MTKELRKAEVYHALQVKRTTALDFCENLEKPNGEIGLSRTHWYAVLRGDRNSDWLEKVQTELVEEAKIKSPHTFNDLYKDFGIEGKLPTN